MSINCNNITKTLIIAISAGFIYTISSILSSAFAAEKVVTTEPDKPSKSELLTIKESDIIIGNSDAKVTIIEYASMSCSHCAAFHNNTFPELKEQFLDTGKAKLVFRDFPLDESALRAAQLVRCAEPESREKFLKVIFRTQNNWTSKRNYLEVLSNIAKLGGMKGEDFDTCIADKNLEDQIMTSRLNAAEVLEVRSTPTFFINGNMYPGAKDLEYFSNVINNLLPEKEKIPTEKANP